MIKFKLLNSQDAAKFLKLDDDYILNLTESNLEIITNKKETTISEYKEIIDNACVDWTQNELLEIENVEKIINKALKDNNIKLDGEVCIIKTNGDEGFSMPYTRMNAIILIEHTRPFGNSKSSILNPSLIAHELFHIISRNNPHIRDCLYSIFSFVKNNNSLLIESMKNKIIVNPDAIHFDHYIKLNYESGFIIGTPIITLNEKTKRFEWDNIAIAEKNNQGIIKCTGELINSNRTDLNNIIQNTSYTCHPEEIAAEHFRLTLIGNKVKDAEIIKEFKEKISKFNLISDILS